MTPHEEEMLTEIQDLHARLARSEKGRLKWMLISFLALAALGFMIWRSFG
ncbi:MAG: hypothetical protein P1U89_18350 [Verrucomicrobiales bacterium]|nr:hypothetical protein [Verrucomicrobiales bacterium]